MNLPSTGKRYRATWQSVNKKYGLQLRLPAIVERVSELAFSCNQIGDYPNCHHRAFIQQLMEADAEIHSEALS